MNTARNNDIEISIRGNQILEELKPRLSKMILDAIDTTFDEYFLQKQIDKMSSEISKRIPVKQSKEILDLDDQLGSEEEIKDTPEDVGKVFNGENSCCSSKLTRPRKLPADYYGQYKVFVETYSTEEKVG